MGKIDMRPTLLFIVLLLSTNLAGISGGQSVDRPAPPETVVGFIQGVDIWQTGTPGVTNFDTLINFTFTKSPQDDGSFQYNLWETNPAGSTLKIDNPGAVAVPGRPDWLFLVHQVASTDNGSYQFRWSANNTAQFESDLSCTLSLELRGPNLTIDQCGENAEIPLGLSAIVTTRTVPNAVGNVTVEIAQSASDNDANWTYILQGATDQVIERDLFGRPTVIERDFFEFDPDARNFNRTGTGFRAGIVQPTGLGLSNAYLRVSAFDNLTRWQSPESCEIAVDIGKTQASAFCGEITDPSLDFPVVPGGVTTPQFPLVNLTSLSGALNASVTLTGVGFGFGIVATGAVAGLAIGIIPAILLAAVGLALAVALNLLPPWWLVVVFMAALSTLLFRGDKE